jgi:hypothetical protein
MFGVTIVGVIKKEASCAIFLKEPIYYYKYITCIFGVKQS